MKRKKMQQKKPNNFSTDQLLGLFILLLINK